MSADIVTLFPNRAPHVARSIDAVIEATEHEALTDQDCECILGSVIRGIQTLNLAGGEPDEEGNLRVCYKVVYFPAE
jgi:hypothetical protein